MCFRSAIVLELYLYLIFYIALLIIKIDSEMVLQKFAKIDQLELNR